MKLPAAQAFTLYVLVFLAVVMAAWLVFVWKTRRASLKNAAKLPCGKCGFLIPLRHCQRKVRCPRCGAINGVAPQA